MQFELMLDQKLKLAFFEFSICVPGYFPLLFSSLLCCVGQLETLQI